jgi:S-adenosylmethionine:tRNA ribosyltransferase-isomerase
VSSVGDLWSSAREDEVSDAGFVDGLGDWELPPELEAVAPPEERGRSGRDDVRLMVARRQGLTVSHHAFRELPHLLEPGDVLVVNTSATLPAAVDGRVTDTCERRAEAQRSGAEAERVSECERRAEAQRSGAEAERGSECERRAEAQRSGAEAERGSECEPVVVHFSTRRSDSEWVVELRTPDGRGSTRQRTVASDGAREEVTVRLTGGARLTLVAPVSAAGREGMPQARLWRAYFGATDPLAYLARYGRPIRYSYTDADRDLTAYQTVFAEPSPRAGSAEMPSAARPFTADLVTRLVSRGVQVVPLTLHTGVASVESHEPPYAEWFEVPEPTARVVNAARAAGSRVVAVGTTAVRALESAADASGVVRPRSGWTEVVITPERGVRVVDGLVTGFHEPRASHLLMLEAVAGRALLDRSYAEALREGYLWHEFGDLHLILTR